LTRAVWVVDSAAFIRLAGIVPEVSQPPAYGKALEAVQEILAH